MNHLVELLLVSCYDACGSTNDVVELSLSDLATIVKRMFEREKEDNNQLEVNLYNLDYTGYDLLVKEQY